MHKLANLIIIQILRQIKGWFRNLNKHDSYWLGEALESSRVSYASMTRNNETWVQTHHLVK